LEKLKGTLDERMKKIESKIKNLDTKLTPLYSIKELVTDTEHVKTGVYMLIFGSFREAAEKLGYEIIETSDPIIFSIRGVGYTHQRDNISELDPDCVEWEDVNVYKIKFPSEFKNLGGEREPRLTILNDIDGYLIDSVHYMPGCCKDDFESAKEERSYMRKFKKETIPDILSKCIYYIDEAGKKHMVYYKLVLLEDVEHYTDDLQINEILDYGDWDSNLEVEGIAHDDVILVKKLT
jgi:hypothetical protein